MNHIVEVLTGADTEKIKRWGHDQLSTYGIGKEHSRAEWQTIGRELIRLGFCSQSAERMSTLDISAEGMAWLKARTPLNLTRPTATTKSRPSRPTIEGDVVCDEFLFAQLRTLRRSIAEERNVPPYIIFPDVTLRHLAARQPSTEVEFAEIPGVGERKLRDFAAPFLALVVQWKKERGRA
jgi:ATP-dependent DNA helicase RecQ